MQLHRPSGNAAAGLALAGFTAWIWGTLPVGSKILLQSLDVATLTWYRFAGAAVLLLPIALRHGELPAAVRLRGAPLALLAGAGAGKIVNFLTFQQGLVYVSPGTAQIVIQLSPVFMVLCGLLLFRERFHRLQWLGFAILLAGMALFFHPRLHELVADVRHQGLGVLLVVVAALTWGIYLVGQKQLLSLLRPETILLCIYGAGLVVLLPAADPAAAAGLSKARLALLAGMGVMTVASYLAFAAAVDRVEASRVGMLIALTPVIVVVNVTLVARLVPGLLEPERLAPVSLAGGAVVVAGSMLSALGASRGAADRGGSSGAAGSAPSGPRPARGRAG